jgi:hypothetical protein
MLLASRTPAPRDSGVDPLSLAKVYLLAYALFVTFGLIVRIAKGHAAKDDDVESVAEGIATIMLFLMFASIMSLD